MLQRQRPKDVPLPPQPLEGRTSLVQTLARESLMQSIDNLPNFDDTCWVDGTVNRGTLNLQDGYEYNRIFIPRLNRVRKILAEAGPQRQQVIERLERELCETCNGYEPIYKAKHKRVVEATKGLTLKVPDEQYRRQVVAPAATYILAELESYKSLKPMSEAYSLPHLLPVSRVFLFYAMHVLALDHPRKGLSPAAVDALKTYLAATAALPKPSRVAVPAWDARFEESDFRHLLFKEDLGFKDEPMIQLRLYPPLPGYEPWPENYLHRPIKPEIDTSFQKLRSFIRLAYPEESER
jgi:hypothetical protein